MTPNDKAAWPNTQTSPTHLERLEQPAPELTPPTPPAPKPTAEAQTVEQQINSRIEAIRRRPGSSS